MKVPVKPPSCVASTLTESMTWRPWMHEMYKTPDPSSLNQGDIIDFELLKPALKGHQEYIADRKHFVGFCVLTQTCDLVQNPRVAFINLAVIRRVRETFSAKD